MIYFSFSGGLDSTTLLAILLNQNRHKFAQIRPVFFNYGSKHAMHEFNAAQRVLTHYRRITVDAPTEIHPLEVVVIPSGIFSLNSALMAGSQNEVPDAPYEQPGSLASTIVPGRNMVMAAVLAAKAEAAYLLRKAEEERGEANGDLFAPIVSVLSKPIQIVMGMHAGDHALYPDCRPAFVSSLMETICQSTERHVCLSAPFINKTKADIVRMGVHLGAPFELTRSCYKNQASPCGTCGTCQERLAAFRANGIIDPVVYEDPNMTARSSK